jgi:amidase
MKTPVMVEVSEIVQANAVELSRGIQSRQWSCREVMQAYLLHIDRFNPKVNAIVSRVEPELLLAQADERDQQLSKGQCLGWMHGFPQAVKDLTATEGVVTTYGSAAFADSVPAQDALMVKRLRNSGAIIIGKTNTPEFGLGSQTYNALFGKTTNAYDASLTSGGSSGGAASALALRMLPVADGSDMMGSLRNPSAYNNVFGLRPSIGRVPNAPAADVFTNQLGTPGPMARTVKDMAMLLSVQAGFDEDVPTSIQHDPAVFSGSLQCDFKGSRIGWLGDFGGHLQMAPGVMDMCGDALDVLTGLGCRVDAVLPAFSMPSLWEAWLVLRQWQVAAGPAGVLYQTEKGRAQLKPEAIWEVEQGLGLTAMQVQKAITTRSAWYQSLRELFRTCDYLLLPSAQVFAFDARTHWPQAINDKPMDTYHRWMEVVVPATMSGCPAAGVPIGFDSAGRAMGMQIIGKAQADLEVLQLAFAYEQATLWVDKFPPPMLCRL